MSILHDWITLPVSDALQTKKRLCEESIMLCNINIFFWRRLAFLFSSYLFRYYCNDSLRSFLAGDLGRVNKLREYSKRFGIFIWVTVAWNKKRRKWCYQVILLDLSVMVCLRFAFRINFSYEFQFVLALKIVVIRSLIKNGVFFIKRDEETLKHHRDFCAN